jgi:hypothetical protein
MPTERRPFRAEELYLQFAPEQFEGKIGLIAYLRERSSGRNKMQVSGIH